MRISPGHLISLTSVTYSVFSHYRNLHRLFAKNSLLNRDFLEEFQLLLEVCWCRPPFCIQNARVDLKFHVPLDKFHSVVRVDFDNLAKIHLVALLSGFHPSPYLIEARPI